MTVFDDESGDGSGSMHEDRAIFGEGHLPIFTWNGIHLGLVDYWQSRGVIVVDCRPANGLKAAPSYTRCLYILLNLGA
jgi:hypothetical protein